METTADLMGTRSVGPVARAKDRRPTWVRDFADRWAAGGDLLAQAHLVLPSWGCPVKTWTEGHPAIAPRACLTERARA